MNIGSLVNNKVSFRLIKFFEFNRLANWSELNTSFNSSLNSYKSSYLIEVVSNRDNPVTSNNECV